MSNTLSPDIERDVRALVEAKAAPFTIDRFSLRVGEDADGEETIFVEVWFPLTHVPIETRQLMDMQFAVGSYFRDRGEKRFAWVRKRFADGQKFGTAA